MYWSSASARRLGRRFSISRADKSGFCGEFYEDRISVNFVGLVGVIIAIPAILALVTIATKTAFSLTWPERRECGCVISRCETLLFSGLITCIVFVGVLFILSVKEELAKEWDHQKKLLRQLQALVPALEDDTFVVISYRPPTYYFASYMRGDLRAYLQVLYDNVSIAGNTSQQLLDDPNGIQSKYYGEIEEFL